MNRQIFELEIEENLTTDHFIPVQDESGISEARKATPLSIRGVIMKGYSVTMTQTTGGDPAVTTFFDNLPGGTPTVTRDSTGIYLITSVGSFEASRTFIVNNFRMLPGTGTDFKTIYIQRISDDVISITSSIGPNGSATPADSQLFNTDIQIIVYP